MLHPSPTPLSPPQTSTSTSSELSRSRRPPDAVAAARLAGRGLADLPAELLILVVGHLASDHRHTFYEISNSSQCALAALSSTSHLFRDLVHPFLYRDPVLGSAREVGSFARTFERWVNPWTMLGIEKGERELPKVHSLAINFPYGAAHPNRAGGDSCSHCVYGLDRPRYQLPSGLLGTISHFLHLTCLSFVECAISDSFLVALLEPSQPLRTQLQCFHLMDACVHEAAIAWIIEAPAIFGIQDAVLGYGYPERHPSDWMEDGEYFRALVDDFQIFRRLAIDFDVSRSAIADQQPFDIAPFANLRKLTLRLAMDDGAELLAILYTPMFRTLQELVIDGEGDCLHLDDIDCLTIRHAITPPQGSTIAPGKLSGGAGSGFMAAWPPLSRKELGSYETEVGVYYGPKLEMFDLGRLCVHLED